MRALIFLLILSALAAANRKDEIKALYDEVIEKTREDMIDEIKTLKNPFIKPMPPAMAKTGSQKTDVNQTQPQLRVLNLHAIINNRVKINDSWYQKGETIHGYRISTITPYTVSLISIIDDGRASRKTLHLLDTNQLDIKHSLKQPDIKVEIK